MSESAAAPVPPAGLVESVGMACRLVWRRRIAMLTVLAPILVPVLLVRAATELIRVDGAAAIVDGRVTFVGGSAVADGVALVALVVGWGAAVVAGVVVAGSALVGVEVIAVDVLRAVGRRALRIAGSVALVVVVAVLATLMMGAFLVGTGGVGGLVVAFIGLLLVGLLVATLMLSFGAVALEPYRAPTVHALALCRGRAIRTGGIVLVGGFVVPLLVGTATRALGWALPLPDLTVGVAGSVVATVVGDVALIAAVAVQGTTVAVAYLQPRTHDLHLVRADIPRVHKHLRSLGRTRQRRWLSWRSAAVLVATPALVVGAVAVWNPWDGPVVRSFDTETMPNARHAIWAPGGISVAGGFQVIDCLDSNCRQASWRDLGQYWPWDAAATFDNERTLIAAAVAGLGDGRLSMLRCPRDAHCETRAAHWETTRADDPALALAAAGDGTVWIAAAEDLGDVDVDPEGEPDVELSLTRCSDWTCEEQYSVILGRVYGWAHGDPMYNELHDDGFWSDHWHHNGDVEVGPVTTLDVAVEADGRPLLSFRAPGQMWLASCDKATCASPVLASHTGSASAVPVGGVADGVVMFEPGAVRHCRGEECRETFLDGVWSGSVVGDGAVASVGDGFAALYAIPKPGDDLRIALGEPEPDPWQLVLLHCRDRACADSSRIPLTSTPYFPRDGILLVDDDGRVRVLHHGPDGGQAVTLDLPAG